MYTTIFSYLRLTAWGLSPNTSHLSCSITSPQVTAEQNTNHLYVIYRESAWGVIDEDPDPFRRLHAMFKRTVRQIMSWNDKKVGCVKLQLMIAWEVVFRLDVVIESQQLSGDEPALCAHLK